VPTEMVTKGESRAFAAPAAAAVPAGERRFRAALRRLRSERTLPRWVVAWLGASVLGIVNGGIRDFAYEERVGESTAGQISTGTLIALLTLYFWVLQRRWPLASRQGEHLDPRPPLDRRRPDGCSGNRRQATDLAGRARNRSPVRLPGPDARGEAARPAGTAERPQQVLKPDDISARRDSPSQHRSGSSTRTGVRSAAVASPCTSRPRS
jgi:hypothetical protein